MAEYVHDDLIRFCFIIINHFIGLSFQLLLGWQVGQFWWSIAFDQPIHKGNNSKGQFNIISIFFFYIYI